MSNQRDLDLAEQALRQLRSTAVPVEDADRVEQRRPRLVAVLEREIVTVPKVRVARERRTRVVSAMLAAAAVVVLAWGTVRLTDDRTDSTAAVNAPEPGAQVRSWSGDVSLGPPGHQQDLGATEGTTALNALSFLSTRQSGWVELELPGAVRVEVNAETEVQVLRAEPGERHVRLTRGRLDLHVPKPAGGGATRLVVSTPDAEVEVRGTVFSVEVRPSRFDAGRWVTEVVVSRGAVAVRQGDREVRVPAGSRWSSDREPAVHGSAVPQEAGPEAKSPVEKHSSSQGAQGSPARAPSEEKPSKAGPSSTLAEQNRLFERALIARDRGSWGEVVELCDRFLARYPGSTLTETVKTERARAAERLAGDTAGPR